MQIKKCYFINTLYKARHTVEISQNFYQQTSSTNSMIEGHLARNFGQSLMSPVLRFVLGHQSCSSCGPHFFCCSSTRPPGPLDFSAILGAAGLLPLADFPTRDRTRSLLRLHTGSRSLPLVTVAWVLGVVIAKKEKQNSDTNKISNSRLLLPTHLS